MPHRSLQHEYAIYIECEIEAYKDSVSRSALLRIGDEAVSALAAREQLAMTEILLCEEVDRIISSRLRLPSYRTWQTRRRKALGKLREPAAPGRAADSMLAATLLLANPGHVLMAGNLEEEPALYLAANGCEVTAIVASEEMMTRLLLATAAVGLSSRVRTVCMDLAQWTPDGPLGAVICAATALAELSTPMRAEVIARLQHATPVGGLHLVRAADAAPATETGEIRACYSGWTVSEDDRGTGSFLARKEVA